MDRETVEEIKRYFGIVAEDLRADTRATAEGLALLTDKVGGLETRFEALQHEVRREFAETQAMIRLSYSELDRRLRDVEQG
jgi:hypothetical protein